MKRQPALRIAVIGVALLLGAASWYWLRELDAAVDPPLAPPAIEAPPVANTNLAAKE
jgi:hypothetical protein